MSKLWAQVATCPDLLAAQILKSQLMSSGIEAHIPDELTVGVSWDIRIALGGLRVMVLESQLEEARRLIAAARPDDAALAEEAVGELEMDSEFEAARRDIPARFRAGADETPPSVETTAEQRASKAFRTAIIALVMIWLLPYALHMSVTAITNPDQTPRGRKRALGALAICFVQALGIGFLVRLLV